MKRRKPKKNKRKFYYCKKHKQKYNTYLIDCPICVGESMWVEPVTIKIYKRRKRRKKNGNKLDLVKRRKRKGIQKNS